MHFTATAKTATGTETVLRSESPAPALPERLAQAFAALDLAGLDYCLLRGAEELYGAGDLEIDVLVAAAHLAAFSHVLQECGFASLPTWGHAPHHFYQGYDRQQGRWLKFDAVTVLRFGHPVRSLQIDLATEYLRQRQRTAGIFTLAPGDEFFALLLHGLLDKRDFRSVRKQRLIELWYCVTAQAEANEVLRKRVASYLQPALHVEDLARACAAGDFHGVLARQARLVQRLTRGQRATHAWRRFTAQATRRMRPLLFALRRPGVSLALLAPDGAGKSTLAMALQRDAGLRARAVGHHVEARMRRSGGQIGRLHDVESERHGEVQAPPVAGTRNTSELPVPDSSPAKTK